MAHSTVKRVVLAAGIVGTLAGLLVLIQVPSANQYHETTLSAAGIGVLLVLFGVKTLAESQE